jgi:hypothetical protein
MGASTGICAEETAVARLAGFFGGVQIRPGLIAVRFRLLQIALGDGVVLV